MNRAANQVIVKDQEASAQFQPAWVRFSSHFTSIRGSVGCEDCSLLKFNVSDLLRALPWLTDDEQQLQASMCCARGHKSVYS